MVRNSVSKTKKERAEIPQRLVTDMVKPVRDARFDMVKDQ